MKHRINRIRIFAVLISDTAYYWRTGRSLRTAWYLAKRTFK